MGFKKGQSGNPRGRASEKPWRDALLLAINDVSEDRKKKLRLAAEMLVTKALEGDVSALKELGDRLDGKPRQEIEATVENHHFVIEAPAPQDSTLEWASQHAPKAIQ